MLSIKKSNIVGLENEVAELRSILEQQKAEIERLQQRISLLNELLWEKDDELFKSKNQHMLAAVEAINARAKVSELEREVQRLQYIEEEYRWLRNGER